VRKKFVIKASTDAKFVGREFVIYADDERAALETFVATFPDLAEKGSFSVELANTVEAKIVVDDRRAPGE